MKKDFALQSIPFSNILMNGLALFSMFFGAGNVIFPLIIGQTVGKNLGIALFGLFLTAIVVPFSGVISVTLFEGNYHSFFKRIGKKAGYLIILLLFCMIGPFGGIPRLISLCFSSVNIYFPSISLPVFSLISCLFIFLLTIKKNRIIDLLGFILTPILVGCLSIIIIKGFISGSNHETYGKQFEPLSAFAYGLREGYNTMDLLASFFFASFLYKKIKTRSQKQSCGNSLAKTMLLSSILGAFLLTMVYVGFSYVSSFHGSELQNVPKGQLLGRIGSVVLGREAGLIICLVIVLSCLTTAIALTVLCGEFLRENLVKNKLSYLNCLAITLVISWSISTLNFDGIISILAPILEIIYPALLVLSFCNIVFKTFQINSVKRPFYFTLIVSFVNSLIYIL